MTDPSFLDLVRAAADADGLDDLAQVLLGFVRSDRERCAIWSRFGNAPWRTVASHGEVPTAPPADGEPDWHVVTVLTASRVTTVGVSPPDLTSNDRALLQGVLKAACRRFDAEVAVEVATYGGDQRLATVLDAAPDAVVVVGLDGRILQANARAVEFFGYPLSELVGSPVERLVPADLRIAHERHRGVFAKGPTRRPMAAGQDLHALHRDGTAIPVDIALSPVDTGDHRAIAAFVRDATPRRRAEADRARVRDADLARRQAFELNDNVVQGLTSAIWLLESDLSDTALATLRDTLAEARQMMAELLERGETPPGPGELRRTTTAPPNVRIDAVNPGDRDPGGGGGLRVLLVDDSDDVRFLLAARLETTTGMFVVGAASDGLAALQAVDEHAPDVVLMDLSMPRMDGLEATAALRRTHPDLRIVILTGHASESLRHQAMEAGADAYIEKGSDFDTLLAAVRGEPAVS